MTATAEAVEAIRIEAENLCLYAEAIGVSLRIDRVPRQPLAMGNQRYVVETWPARQNAAPNSVS